MSSKIISILFLGIVFNTLSAQSFVFKKKSDAYVFKKNSLSKLDYAKSYYDVGEFYKGYCVVSNGEKWGAVNSEGEISIPIMYDDVIVLREHLFLVMKNNLYGIVDYNNRVLIEIIHPKIKYQAISWDDTSPLPPQISIEDTSYIYKPDSMKFVKKVKDIKKDIYKVAPYMPAFFKECKDSSIDNSDHDKCQRNSLNDYVIELLKKENVWEFSAIVQFVINRDKSISDINVVRTNDNYYNDIIHKIVAKIPVYEPGRNRKEEAVNVLYTLAIKVK